MSLDSFPLPNLEEILEDLEGYPYFTTLDKFSGFLKNAVVETCKDMTTFPFKLGTSGFEVIQFELTNASVTFKK